MKNRKEISNKKLNEIICPECSGTDQIICYEGLTFGKRDDIVFLMGCENCGLKYIVELEPSIIKWG